MDKEHAKTVILLGQIVSLSHAILTRFIDEHRFLENPELEAYAKKRSTEILKTFTGQNPRPVDAIMALVQETSVADILPVDNLPAIEAPAVPAVASKSNKRNTVTKTEFGSNSEVISRILLGFEPEKEFTGQDFHRVLRAHLPNLTEEEFKNISSSFSTLTKRGLVGRMYVKVRGKKPVLGYVMCDGHIAKHQALRGFTSKDFMTLHNVKELRARLTPPSKPIAAPPARPVQAEMELQPVASAPAAPPVPEKHESLYDPGQINSNFEALQFPQFLHYILTLGYGLKDEPKVEDVTHWLMMNVPKFAKDNAKYKEHSIVGKVRNGLKKLLKSGNIGTVGEKKSHRSYQVLKPFEGVYGPGPVESRFMAPA